MYIQRQTSVRTTSLKLEPIQLRANRYMFRMLSTFRLACGSVSVLAAPSAKKSGAAQ